MARGKRKSRLRFLLALATLAAVSALLWVKRETLTHAFEKLTAGTTAPARTEAGATAPALEPHQQRISGMLVATGLARDVQLGVSANSAVLFRHVEMFQWQEHCDGTVCRYETGWAAPVDSHKFRERKGHENPVAPFNDSIFFAPGLKLGEFALDPELLLAQLHASEYAVHNANLPPNLAASFGERDGVLYAGGDGSHPAIGEVRISYRVIPNGPATLIGVVRDGKLVMH
jgi:hypothetical protein